MSCFFNQAGWMIYFEEIAGKIENGRVVQALKKSFWKGNEVGWMSYFDVIASKIVWSG